MVARHPGPEVSKQLETMMLPAPCFTVRVRIWFGAFFFFLQTFVSYLLSIEHFLSSTVEHPDNSAWTWNVPQQVCLDSNDFHSLLILPPILLSIFLLVDTSTKTLNVFFFAVLLRVYLFHGYLLCSWCDLRRTPTPWESSESPEFPPFVANLSYRESTKTRVLRNALVRRSRLCESL